MLTTPDEEGGPMAARLVGVAALFMGAALLAFLVVDVPLPITLTLSAVGAAGLVAWAWMKSPVAIRRRIRRQAVAGLAGGLVAVAVYDAIRIGLAGLDPSPYDPLEAIRGFGRALIGESADPALPLAVGFVFHVVTGTLFGLGYVSLVVDPRRSGLRSWVVRGVAWALFLEVFQLLFYPDWLGIVLVREFTIIATTAHISYGIVLGLVAREVLLRFDRREPWQA